MPAINTDSNIRDGAWVVDATDYVNIKTWLAGTRLVLRKERPHPGAVAENQTWLQVVMIANNRLAWTKLIAYRDHPSIGRALRHRRFGAPVTRDGTLGPCSCPHPLPPLTQLTSAGPVPLNGAP